MSSEKDHRGKSTAHTYDPFGRETSVTFPDNTTATVSYGWSEEGTNALYAITRSVTGKPTTKSVYDALNREVRTAETRFNGSFLKRIKFMIVMEGCKKSLVRLPVVRLRLGISIVMIR